MSQVFLSPVSTTYRDESVLHMPGGAVRRIVTCGHIDSARSTQKRMRR